MNLLRNALLFFALPFLLLACAKNNPSPMALPSFVKSQGSTYVLSQGNTQIEILANVAGRIGSLKIDGQEMLFTSDKSENAIWGSVLWSSPQSEWNWPPIEILDSAPYKVDVADNQLVFTSQLDAKTGYQFTKHFGVDTQKKCITIQYTIANKTTVVKNVAAWEVTRLNPAGSIFFPQGNTENSSGIFYPIPITHINDMTWSVYDVANIQSNSHKLLTDGKEGWVAYSYHNKILIKEFKDVPVELIVPGEGEIEIYANGDNAYWEVGQQSAMTKLLPDEQLDWNVNWYTRTLPANMSTFAGSEELINYVRSVLRGEN